MNRRTFLAQTLGAAVTARAAAPRVRIAFVGGRHSHGLDKARVVQRLPDYELVGIWEDDPKVMEEYTRIGVPKISREAALGDKTIAAIAVESEVRDHEEHARLALDAGKHLHLEKPPSDDMATFRALAATAERKRLLLQTGYMWRYNPALKAALEAARSGWLGDVYLMRGMMNTLIPAERRPEWARFKGGQMFEQGGHLIDAVVRVLGRPEKVTPFLRKHGSYNDNLMDNTVAILEYPKALAVIQSSTLQPGANAHRTIEIQGTNGTAVVRPIEPPRLQIDLVKAAGPYKAGTQMVEVGPYQRFVDDFIELAAAIRGEKKLTASLEHELLLHEILLRASQM